MECLFEGRGWNVCLKAGDGMFVSRQGMECLFESRRWNVCLKAGDGMLV